MDRPAILLAEYAEAGQVCRAQEQYVRSTLSMYLIFAGALVALMTTKAVPSPMALVYVSFAGFAVGVCMLWLVLRHRAIYGAFVQRAKAIEAELQMTLYSQSNLSVSMPHQPTAKTMSAFIIGIIAFGFLIAGIVFAAKA
ncbi:MAG: hypothetical protein HYX43_14695 [Burkholderiales bacterium]|nr:hypothetical protein [Burkholderiales bacterium]